MVVANGGNASNGPFETYLSAAFETNVATLQAQSQTAFKTFVITKYAIKTTDVNPQCLLHGDEAGALAGVKAQMKFFGARGKLIETGWKMAK